MVDYSVGTAHQVKEATISKGRVVCTPSVCINFDGVNRYLTPQEAEHFAHLLVTNAEICKILPRDKT